MITINLYSCHWKRFQIDRVLRHNIEIPAILISLIVLAAGPVGGWVLRKRKQRVAFVFSLLAVVSLVATFLLALLLVFS